MKSSTAPDPLSPAGAVVASSDTYNLYLSSAGLNANTTYYFRVTGINSNNIITDYTTARGTSTLVANAPLFVDFTNVYVSSIQFNWSANGNPAGTRYRVKSSTAPDPLSPAGAVVASSDAYNLYLSSAGLVANTTYYFRVAGINNNDVATDYTTAQGTSTLANIPLTAVSTFSAVKATGFTASWNNNSNSPGTIYTAQVSTASDFNTGATNQITASTAPVDGYSYTFTGLSCFTTYYFRVKAVNHNRIYTNYAELGSTRTLHLPSPVIGAIIGVSTYSLKADWNLVDGATGYVLAASTKPENPPSPVWASSTTLGDLSATVFDPALVPNTTHYLFVSANSKDGSSNWSAYPATSTWANPPLAVASTFSAVGTGGFTTHWDNNLNPMGDISTLYTAQVSTAPDFNAGATDQVTLSTAPKAGPSATFDGLSSDTWYYF
ncbi:MAG: fibronectin type III domain-containing protein, partial [Elusimicrobia bacterium]|nr:fibronectin type III domain-containing protein [Elusimicrobiota bacterium]